MENKDTMCSLLPDTLLEEGYPTDKWLSFLRFYRPDESLPLLIFVKEVLPKGWNGRFELYEDKNEYRLELHTGGWSDNEAIIKSLLSNTYLINFKMRYVKWEVGGHYYFEIKS